MLRISGAALAVLALCVPSSTQAQRTAREPVALRVTVRTVDGVPIGGAAARLGASAAAESDEAGHATFVRATSGSAWLRVRRIGYRPDSMHLTLVSGVRLDTAIVLHRIVVELAPFTTIGRRELRGPLAGFYQRRAMGSGYFITRADIMKRAPIRVTDLLRDVPGVRVSGSAARIRGANCAPVVWLDGLRLHAAGSDLETFDALSLEGIEVYTGSGTTPVEYQTSMRMAMDCGTILLWSRRGEARAPSTPRDGPSPAARIAQLLDSLHVYTADDVDSVARMDSSELVHPVYPDSLHESLTPGLVLAEFVVDANGDVVIETFNAVTTTHRDFVDAVRRAVHAQRFVPAVRQGRTVQQVVQQPFRFVPDSAARRRR